MIKKESDCVGCGLPCWGNACPHYEVITLICDKCGCEADELYKYYTDGFIMKQLCLDCMKDACRLHNIKCSECGTVVDDLKNAYNYGYDVLCEECFEQMAERVTGDG